MPSRVLVTPAAAALIRQFQEQHGPLILHQSGGCCEGTAPMCFRQADFRVGQRDILLGGIEGVPFYVGAAHYQYLAPSQLTLDVTSGGGDSFSLEARDGVRFAVRSRLFSDEELAELAEERPLASDPDALCG